MCQSVMHCLSPNFIQSKGKLDTSPEAIAQTKVIVDVGSSMTFSQLYIHTSVVLIGQRLFCLEITQVAQKSL